MTVAVIACWKKLHTPTFTMLACLALSDAHSLLQFYLWSRLEFQQMLRRCFPENTKAVMTWRYILLSIAEDNTWVQMSLLAVLRYLAIVHPLKYKIHCTSKIVILASVSGWVILVIISAVRLPLLHFHQSILMYVDLILYIMRFICPTSFFVTLHCLKVRALRLSPVLNQISEIKMNIIVTVILVIYGFSSALYIASFASMVMEWNIKSIDYITLFSITVNCAVNPYIYVLSSPQVITVYSTLTKICKRNIDS